MGILEGKVAIVTGAGQGIGLAIANAYAAEGARVVIAEKEVDRVKQAESSLRENSFDVLAVQCDISNQDDVKSTVATAVEAYGQLDILVNNAATAYDQYSIAETTNEYLNNAVQTNLFGTFWFMQEALPHLQKRGGRVINFASEAGTEGWANLTGYNTTKEAIRALTRTAAKEWGQFGITVNALCPFAASPAIQWYRDTHPEQFAGVLSTVPLGRVGDCEEDIAPVAVFFASEASQFITGHTIMVDGGRSVLR